jgi:hypothetical protein
MLDGNALFERDGHDTPSHWSKGNVVERYGTNVV